MTDFSKELNAPQLEAVEATQGPLLILAGAGSGKTRVLTYRVAHLILQGEASPQEILCVTFTNKAAREMESRCLSLLQEKNIPIYEPMWISTFHSTCLRILREQIHLLGYQPGFSIYDDSDQLSLIKKVLQKLNINEKVYPAKTFKSAINEAKTQALHPDQVEKRASYLMDERTLAVYKEYEQQMSLNNALDFGDLLFKTYELFQMYPDILELYQDRFQYIMVDEYQDTNRLQYLLIGQLASKHKNLCVVGDEDQSIYSWRGADISNILDFEKDFPNAKVVKLEENYRSTKTIVEAASHIIKNNTQRKDKTLFTNNESGNKITVREETNEYEEARFVVNTVEDLMSKGGYRYSDFAVFYRTNAQSRVLEEQFRTRSIPYRLVGGLKFYDRMEVKNIIAYMRAVLNPKDEVGLKRIINVPARGIGKSTVEKIERYAIDNNVSFIDAIPKVAQEKLVHAGAAKKILAFKNLIDSLCSLSDSMSLTDIFLRILDDTGYVMKLKEENTAESLARVDNIEELNNAIHQFEKERGEEASLQTFLEEMALVSDADSINNTDQAVTLMTLHVSKGLEFPNVFVVGMEEGLFPSGRSFDSSDPTAIEEERRLAYVGMTRARENLFLTHARNRRVWGQEQSHPPARFIKEIPDKFLKKESSISRPKFMSRFESQSSGSPQSYQQHRTDSFTEFDAMPNYEDFGDEAYSDGASNYSKGMRVRHPTFGVGSIYKVEGKGDNLKVSVVFNDHTTKKFVVKYARLERV